MKILVEIHNFYGYAALIFANSIIAVSQILKLVVFLFPLYLILKLMDEDISIQKFNLDDYISIDFQTYMLFYLILILVYILISIYLYKNRINIHNPIVASELTKKNLALLKGKPARDIIWAAIAFESDLLLVIFLALGQMIYMPQMIIVNVFFFIIFTLFSTLIVVNFKGEQEVVDFIGLIIYVLILAVFAWIAINDKLSTTIVAVIFFVQRLMVMSMIRLEKNSIKLNKLI